MKKKIKTSVLVVRHASLCYVSVGHRLRSVEVKFLFYFIFYLAHLFELSDTCLTSVIGVSDMSASLVLEVSPHINANQIFI